MLLDVPLTSLYGLFLFTVNKIETLMRYKFSLAFENSNEEDYVTEKFFQSLVAGMQTILVDRELVRLYGS